MADFDGMREKLTPKQAEEYFVGYVRSHFANLRDLAKDDKAFRKSLTTRDWHSDLADALNA